MKSLRPLSLGLHNCCHILLGFSLCDFEKVSNSGNLVIFFHLKSIQMILFKELPEHNLEFISHNVNSSLFFSYGLMIGIFKLLLSLLETI